VFIEIEYIKQQQKKEHWKEWRDDVKADLLNRLCFPVLPNNVEFISVIIDGGKGTGKTSKMKRIAELLVEMIEEQGNTYNIIPVRSIKQVPQYFNDADYQIALIDDGSRYDKRLGGKVIEQFNEIRHIFEEIRTSGVLIIIWTLQDSFQIGKILRKDLSAYIFNSFPMDEYSANFIRRTAHPLALQYLNTWTTKVRDEHLLKFKGKCIVATESWAGYAEFGLPKTEFFKQLKFIDPETDDSSATEDTDDTEEDVEEDIKQDATFYEILQHFVTKIAKKIRQTEEWYYDALNMKYFSEHLHSWREIAEVLNEKYDLNLRADSYRVGVRKILISFSNTDWGNVLEFAVLRYLNTRLRQSGLQQTFSRFSGSDRPDLLFSDQRLALNCKLYLDNRPSWTVLCAPEYQYPDCWVAFYSPESGLVFYHNEDHEKKPTLKMRGKERNVCSVEDFLAYVQEYVKKQEQDSEKDNKKEKD